MWSGSRHGSGGALIWQVVPEFLVAEYIAVNKDALQEDIREQAEQIEELRASLEAKRREAAALREAGDGDGEGRSGSPGGFGDDDASFAG